MIAIPVCCSREGRRCPHPTRVILRLDRIVDSVPKRDPEKASPREDLSWAAIKMTEKRQGFLGIDVMQHSLSVLCGVRHCGIRRGSQCCQCWSR